MNIRAPSEPAATPANAGGHFDLVAGLDPNGPVQALLDRFAVEQAERRRRYNDVTNERKRQRELTERIKS